MRVGGGGGGRGGERGCWKEIAIAICVRDGVKNMLYCINYKGRCYAFLAFVASIP